MLTKEPRSLQQRPRKPFHLDPLERRQSLPSIRKCVNQPTFLSTQILPPIVLTQGWGMPRNEEVIINFDQAPRKDLWLTRYTRTGW
jgi:hypothetical protein